MKKVLFFIILLSIVASCSSKSRQETSGFPLEKGTTWTYSYQTYEPSPSDPAQVIQAAYQLTETVTDTEVSDPYLIAHIKRDYQLTDIDPDWTGDYEVSQAGEYWYVIDGQKVFESRSPVDSSNINTNVFLLDYRFPLALGKSWCLQSLDSKNPSSYEDATCEFIGKRMVTNREPYETPAGRFEDCYEFTDYYNGGNFIHWFCTGVGVVFRKFDHAGTRFGFEQTLTRFSNGTP